MSVFSFQIEHKARLTLIYQYLTLIYLGRPAAQVVSEFDCAIDGARIRFLAGKSNYELTRNELQKKGIKVYKQDIQIEKSKIFEYEN